MTIAIDMKEYTRLIKEFPTEEFKKELNKLVEYYNKNPFQQRNKKVFLRKYKTHIILINESFPEEEEIEKEELLEVWDDEDLLDYKPEPQEWFIKNQIPKAEVGLLVGKRMERKTFISLYQALCLASGSKVFGEDEVPEMKKVLFIDEETGINEIAKRIKMLKKGMGLEKVPLLIKYISFGGLKFDRKDMKFAEFMKIIEEFEPDLIIVDSLQRCVTFEVDKDNQAISELFTGVVRPIIKSYGCSWLFVHHLRKSPAIKYAPEDFLDEVRGGSELVNYCRYVLMCQVPRGQDENLLIFRVLKMSNAPIPEPKVVSFNSNEDSIKITYEGIPEEVLAGEVQAANAIKEWLFNKQITEFETGKITNAFEEIGFKKTLLSAGLKVLLERGFLEKIKRGHWKVKEEITQTKISSRSS